MQCNILQTHTSQRALSQIIMTHFNLAYENFNLRTAALG